MENFEPNIPAIIADLRIEEYSYYLPTERIASFPLEQRDQSKLMVSQGEEITESRFEQIGSYLPRGSLLVLNNTRVVQARLEFFKETGARIEIFCLQPLQPVSDVHMALGLTSPVHWQ